MALVPYTVQSLAKTDSEGTGGNSNVVSGAVITATDSNGAPATIYDDALSTNPSTAKTTGADGNREIWLEEGVYTITTNGKSSKVDLTRFGGTATQLINSSRAYAAGDVVKVSGFLQSGDGGEAQWKATSTTGLTPSQSPVDRNAAELVDASGRLWELVFRDHLCLNTLGMSESSSCGVYLTIGASIIRDSRVVPVAGTGAVMPVKISAVPGNYFTTTSINAQLLDGMGWEIDLRGSSLRSEAAGKTTLDLLGSRFGTLNGIHIIGDATNVPAQGFQYGRLQATTAADNLRFLNCRTTGNFTRTSAYCLASETEYWDHLELYNYSTSDSAYCHIFDGNNTWGAITDFTAPSMTQYTPMSCIQHTFINPDWRRPNNGPALWASRTDQWKSYNGYAVSADDYLLVMSDDGSGFDDFLFDVHGEKDGCLGAITFEINGGSAIDTVAVRGFTHYDHEGQFTNRVYNIDAAVTKCRLVDVDIKLTQFFPTPSNGLVIPVSKLIMQGRIYTSNSALYKGFEMYGVMASDDATNGSYGVGTYTIEDRATGKTFFKGDHTMLSSTSATVSGASLSSVTNSNFKNGALEPSPSSSAPATEAGVPKLAVDDGTNWSGVNASGTNRLVFWDGANWVAL